MDGFKLARTNLSAVDLTYNLAAVHEAQARRAECQIAIDIGRQRMLQLGQRIAEARRGDIVSPSRAADAMLGGEAIPLSTVADIESERRGLEIGLRELRDREAALGAEETRAKTNAVAPLISAGMPALEPLREMAQQGIDLIFQAYAGAQALSEATANSAASTFAHSLREIVAEAVSERFVVRKPIDVPKPVIDSLSTGSKAIGQLGRRIPTNVPVPDHKLNAPLIGLVASALG